MSTTPATFASVVSPQDLLLEPRRPQALPLRESLTARKFLSFSRLGCWRPAERDQHPLTDAVARRLLLLQGQVQITGTDMVSTYTNSKKITASVAGGTFEPGRSVKNSSILKKVLNPK